MTRRTTRPADRPLHGATVLLTRPPEDAVELRGRLEQLGANVHIWPTIEIRALTGSPEVQAILNRLDRFNWIAFTSRNGVRVVFDWLRTYKRLPLPPMLVGAVGPTTANELLLRGVTADCIPAVSSGTALAAAMVAAGIESAEVLLPVGALAGSEVREMLERAGARVTVARVYETIPAQTVVAEARDALLHGDIDVAAFTSPSAFVNLIGRSERTLPNALRRTRLVAIGPTTAEAIAGAGYVPSAVCARQTMDDMVQTIVDVCRGSNDER